MGITNSDSSLSLIYRYLFQSIDFDEILRIPDTTVVIVFNLESLELGTKTIIHDITLGRVAQNMGAVGQLIIQANGSTLPNSSNF